MNLTLQKFWAFLDYVVQQLHSFSLVQLWSWYSGFHWFSTWDVRQACSLDLLPCWTTDVCSQGLRTEGVLTSPSSLGFSGSNYSSLTSVQMLPPPRHQLLPHVYPLLCRADVRWLCSSLTSVCALMEDWSSDAHLIGVHEMMGYQATGIRSYQRLLTWEADTVLIYHSTIPSCAIFLFKDYK